MSAVLRTRTIAESRGFMKALVGAHHDRIVGFTMLGPEAGEVMAAVQSWPMCRIRSSATQSSRIPRWPKVSTHCLPIFRRQRREQALLSP
jgi:pyruvate/2-oxoglutarate dehydrogenase complex dihydrolipoamide dehydrogenase (E3) component